MALTKEDLQAIKSVVEDVTAPQFKALNERVAAIEVNHGKKLDALLDSQKSSNERLDRMQDQMDSVEKKLENSMIIKAVTP